MHYYPELDQNLFTLIFSGSEILFVKSRWGNIFALKCDLNREKSEKKANFFCVCRLSLDSPILLSTVTAVVER